MGDPYPFVDDGLLMVNQWRDEEAGQSYTEFLTSPDGSNWTLYAADPELFAGEIGISDAIVHDERLVAVGAAWPDGPMGRPQPRVWVYEPPS
jgi:hypothetical protein